MKTLTELLKSILLSSPFDTINPPKTIGICLSGGGALGFAHIGVLQALEDLEIHPQVISGASMGAIVGTLYAAGIKPAKMVEIIQNDKLYKITKLMTFNTRFWETNSLVNNKVVREIIKECVPENKFSALQKTMHVCVSNLSLGKSEIIEDSNNLDTWVAASSAIPGFYAPLRINKMLYVDGGLLNNIPAQPLIKKCDVIIGSDVLPYSVVSKKLTTKDSALASVRVIQSINSQEGRKICDYLFEPKAVEKYHEFSFDAYKEIIHYGYREVVKFVNENPELLRLRSKKATK